MYGHKTWWAGHKAETEAMLDELEHCPTCGSRDCGVDCRVVTVVRLRNGSRV